MTADQQDKFKQLMLILSSAFDYELNAEKIKLWWQMLKNYSVENFEQAIYLAIRECEFFPRISQIVKFIESSTELEAAESWINLIDFLQNKNIELTDVEIEAMRLLGGQKKLSMMNLQDLEFKRKIFIDLYQDLNLKYSKRSNLILTHAGSDLRLI